MGGRNLDFLYYSGSHSTTTKRNDYDELPIKPPINQSDRLSNRVQDLTLRLMESFMQISLHDTGWFISIEVRTRLGF